MEIRMDREEIAIVVLGLAGLGAVAIYFFYKAMQQPQVVYVQQPAPQTQTAQGPNAPVPVSNILGAPV